MRKRDADAWEYVVDEVFEVSPRPLVVGRVFRGQISSGDWFLRDGDVGVVTIQFSPHRCRHDDELTISTDLDLRAGDRLIRFNPVDPGAPVERD